MPASTANIFLSIEETATYMYGKYSPRDVQWCIRIVSVTNIPELWRNYFSLSWHSEGRSGWSGSAIALKRRFLALDVAGLGIPKWPKEQKVQVWFQSLMTHARPRGDHASEFWDEVCHANFL